MSDQEITNEEASRRKCLDCNYDGGNLAEKDSCLKCGHRYNPKDGEICPKCGSEEYESHCPECDSTDIIYWDEYQEMLKDKRPTGRGE